MRASTIETLAIGSGLGLLGLAAGSICGMAVTSGVAQTLLTGMFTFVGGTILSYSAFAVRRATAKKSDAPAVPAVIDPPNVVRVGVGLGTLSVGLIIGAVLGLWFRYRDPLDLAPSPPPKQASEDQKPEVLTKGVGLQLGPEEDQTLARIRDRLKNHYYQTPEVIGDLTDLKAIVDTCQASR